MRGIMDAKQLNMARNLVCGRIRFAEFAVTNACIAKCSFCEIWKQRPKTFTDREQSLKVIDNLADMGVSHITLTGGEPLLHPHIVDFVRKCTARNVHTSVLDAAPSLITDEKLALLTDAGNDMISISFDSDDPKVLEESRKIPGIMRDMEIAVGKIRDTPIKSMASILIWNNNHDRMEQLFDKATDMGFDLISVNYPTFSKSIVYPLGGEGISLSRDLVARSLEHVIELKKSKRYNIINPVASMNNIIDYLRDPASVRYQCLGGYRVMFVDRVFDVRPCMQLPGVLGNALTMTAKDLKKVPCNACNMSWYRDFSDLTSGVKSLPLYWELLQTGRSLL
jgi:MoaA/NifB/PqqE/SkfB family radical SAM enzyme